MVQVEFVCEQRSPLFAYLSLQLVAAINGARMAVCAECGLLYHARRRHGRRESAYCASCGKPAAWRKASKKYYAKKRRARPKTSL
jgi:predicted RNA-binding Zn ribbon-like protein